jgi:hypothetical protein
VAVASMGCCGGKELRSGGVTFGSGVAPGAGAPDRSPLVRTHTAKTADATEVLDRCATRLEQLEESAVAACEQAQEARTCAPSGSTAGDDPTTDEHRLPSGSVLLEASDRRLAQLLHQAEVEVERPLDSIPVSGTSGEDFNRDRRKKYNRRLADVIARLEKERAAVRDARQMDAGDTTVPLDSSLRVDDSALGRTQTKRSDGAAQLLSELETRLTQLEGRAREAAALGAAGRQELRLVLQECEFGFQEEVDAVSVAGFAEEADLRRRRKQCNRRLQELQAQIDRDLDSSNDNDEAIDARPLAEDTVEASTGADHEDAALAVPGAAVEEASA